MRYKAFASIILAVIAFSASADNLHVTHKASMNLDTATQLAKAARAYAGSHDWPCAISIVDDGGWTVLSERMDNAPVVSGVDLAQGKARTSALFKRPSGVLETAINEARPAAITAGMLMMRGGQPVVVEGDVIGAIGISADTPAHDDEISRAALASLNKPQ